MNREPLVLGIETSCDETGVGIVRGTTLLANAIASSMDEQARYGGVVPEIAARAHLEAMTPTLEAALREAGVALADLDAIAVTSGPGLAGALMVGVGAAKALAIALGRPLYAVNHLVGHVGVDLLRPADDGGGPLELPTVALLVSGGHTSLLLVRDLLDDVVLLGETVDDAAGEAFDKVARLLGLPYPGGPQIDRAAATGDPTAIAFPRGLTAARDQAAHRFDFSFSGLKTAVARHVEQAAARGEEPDVTDVAASFRTAVRDGADEQAREQMALAATFAGMGFGNAGVHIPHANAYPIAGRVKEFRPAGYPQDEPMVPHGMAVSLTAPEAFRFTFEASPERHLRAAELLGAGPEDGDKGPDLLPRTLSRLMSDIAMPNGIGAVGYDEGDVDALVEGSLKQQRLLATAPLEVEAEDLAGILRRSLELW